MLRRGRVDRPCLLRQLLQNSEIFRHATAEARMPFPFLFQEWQLIPNTVSSIACASTWLRACIFCWERLFLWFCSSRTFLRTSCSNSPPIQTLCWWAGPFAFLITAGQLTATTSVGSKACSESRGARSRSWSKTSSEFSDAAIEHNASELQPVTGNASS